MDEGLHEVFEASSDVLHQKMTGGSLLVTFWLEGFIRSNDSDAILKRGTV